MADHACYMCVHDPVRRVLPAGSRLHTLGRAANTVKENKIRQKLQKNHLNNDACLVYLVIPALHACLEQVGDALCLRGGNRTRNTRGRARE